MAGLAEAHAGLRRAAISSHLQTDYALASLHLLVGELTLVLCRLLWAEAKLEQKQETVTYSQGQGCQMLV